MIYTKAKAAVIEQLEFDPGPHKYTLKDAEIPGVTTVIDRHFDSFSKLPADVRDAALLRGSVVHALTAKYDQKPETLPTLLARAEAARLDGYLQAWLQFRMDYEPEFPVIETRVINTTYRYAGTVDRLARMHLKGWDGNDLSILEVKTGGLVREYALQTAAYQAAYNEGLARGEPKATRRVVVRLDEFGHYQFSEHKNPTDWQAFVAVLTLDNWKRSKA